ncbi:N-glycosylase/DNA lyase isoform X1 [Protopterus annectens]|uniref:N-glycosylase/DNA lyase isoform X1 n=1 Tax=Protopterus annectens TaxID=7888 RepID=UPI001CFB0832|nr:N-glycosylase/DNA lyase isoform X1 [Protopterus annectens]
MQHHAVLSALTTVWRSIPCSRSELNLDVVLSCGQSFRWKQINPSHWTGVLASQVWTLTQTDDHIWYTTYCLDGEENVDLVGLESQNMEPKQSATSAHRELKIERERRGCCKNTVDAEISCMGKTVTVNPSNNFIFVKSKKTEDDCDKVGRKKQDILMDYFQLNVELESLYKQWGKEDLHFRRVAQEFPGVRILRQDPTECFFSFICTSNNHISRIEGMIERLCKAFGKRLCQLDEAVYYSFPTLEALAAPDVEERLKNLGFGYRAKFVNQSAQTILEKHGYDWLVSLRCVPYEDARTMLRALPGVGAKVADCVCLMSLDKTEAVPVDTHVWQIAKRHYLPHLGSDNKTLTDRLYKEIGNYFHNLWGPYAGWAQSVLFCSDLKKFQSPKTDEVTRQKKRRKLY